MPTADTYARFYIHPSLKSGTAKSSSAIYDDEIYAEIFIKGSTNTSYGRPKKDQDEIDFKEEWEAYVNNCDYVSSGTPLSALPTIGPSAEMNLNAKGIKSVEDLAGLSDAIVIGGERGMLELRNRAQAYLDALNPERAKERDILENAQKATIEELQRMVKELQGAKKTRRKRNAEGKLE